MRDWIFFKRINKSLIDKFVCCGSLLLFSLLINACSSGPQIPVWFNKSSNTDGVLFGYGSGGDYKSARQGALEELSQQLEVSVKSQCAIITSTNQEIYKSRSECFNSLRSSRSLKNTRVLHKKKQAENHFVALQLDLRPLEQILRHKLEKNGIKQRRFKGSQVLLRSPLLTRLKTDDSGVTLSTALQRQQDQWFLSVGDFLQPVADLDELTNWSIKKHLGLQIILDGKKENRVREGTPMTLRIQKPENIKFISLMNVYSDGRVVTLFENLDIDGEEFLFPDPSLNVEMIAGSIIPNSKDRDLYLALISHEALDLTRFPRGENLPSFGKLSYNLHTFLDWVERAPIVGIAPIYISIEP